MDNNVDRIFVYGMQSFACFPKEVSSLLCHCCCVCFIMIALDWTGGVDWIILCPYAMNLFDLFNSFKFDFDFQHEIIYKKIIMKVLFSEYELVYTNNMLVCPVCKEPLSCENHQFVCKNHHTFDQAKEGYVNLSLKQKKMTGDNPAMVRARTAFLEKGYYDFLRDALKMIIHEYSAFTLLDAGCGQGYYTKEFASCVNTVYGVDLSKAAIQYAAKHDKKSTYIVSSIYDCPFRNESFDLVTTIFTPDAKSEFYRLLKPGGYLIQVGPGPFHCFELKSILYENAYLNPEPLHDRPGFTCIDIQNIKRVFLVKDLRSLLEMTPYRYRTKASDLDKIDSYSSLDVTFDFMIHVWRKS